jgi:hypothetical protein
MIDGLKLTLTGEEIKSLIQERITDHRLRVAHWTEEAARTLEDQTEDHPLLPEHACENEAELHEWRADVLTFLRDHLDPSEVYRLGEADLEFAELLPEQPEWLEQDEYEERRRQESELGPFTQRVCDSPECILVENPDWKPAEDRRMD